MFVYAYFDAYLCMHTHIQNLMKASELDIIVLFSRDIRVSQYWTQRVTNAEDGPTHLCKPPSAREVGLKALKIAELN